MSATLEPPVLSALSRLDWVIQQGRTRKSHKAKKGGQRRRRARWLSRNLEGLQVLREVLARETQECLRGADLDEVDAVCLALGERHWGHWSAAVKLVSATQGALELDDDVISNAAAGWRHLAEDAHIILPNLSPLTRKDLRSYAYFAACVLDQIKVQPASVVEAVSDEVEGLYSTPINRIKPEIVLLHARMEVLAVAGSDGGIDEDVAWAVGHNLWRWLLVARRSEPKTKQEAFMQLLHNCRSRAAAHELPFVAKWRDERVAARKQSVAEVGPIRELTTEERHEQDAWLNSILPEEQWELERDEC